jgi:hypothetical protein
MLPIPAADEVPEVAPKAESLTVAVTALALRTVIGEVTVMAVVDVRAPTACDTDNDPLTDPQGVIEESHVRKSASPPYAKVSEWDPTLSTDVVNVAVEDPPPPATSVAIPISAPPSLKVTVPVGAFVATGSTTFAVSVTDEPSVDGLAEEARDALGVTAASAVSPAPAKKINENRKRRIPPDVERAIRGHLCVDSSSRGAREEAPKTLLTCWGSGRHCLSESTKVSIKNRDFRLWKTIDELVNSQTYIS